MHFRHIAAGGLGALRIGLCSLAVAQLSFGATVTSAAANRSLDTRTPIKHVIVIIGENRSFDHVFATYVPKKGESVNNLLSEGIVALDADKNATPGPNFKKAHQLAASDQGGADTFLLSPPKSEFPKNQRERIFSSRKYLRRRHYPACLRRGNRIRFGCRVLSRFGERRHRPRGSYPRHAYYQSHGFACRAISADERQHLPVPGLCREPGAPLLSDVAAVELQRRERHALEPAPTAPLSRRSAPPTPTPSLVSPRTTWRARPRRPPLERVRRLSASTTCSRATRPTSRASRTITP
jgi:hypothetical protein